jgi:CRISPR-associated endoribonuclease Cas6
MLLAAVVHLRALESGSLPSDTGRAVHGLWFAHWKAVAPQIADELHSVRRAQPFTLSPLMGLARPQAGRLSVGRGDVAWLRVTALDDALAARVESGWLPGLPREVRLGELCWQVTGWTLEPGEQPWAGATDASELAQDHLLAANPPTQWRLVFRTPTTFHGQRGHFPFPLPGALMRSWWRRWQAFGPVRLAEDLVERVEAGLLISGYRLNTVPLRDGRRLTIGCVGTMTINARGLKAGERGAVDLLTAYAFWAGTGQHTTQGMGLTRAMAQHARE